MSNIKTLWSSGFVNRWHRDPDPRLRNAMDLTAAHSQRVAVLCDQLFPGQRKGHVIAALYHDAPECMTGDVPYNAKRDWPMIAAALERAEQWFNDAHGIDLPWADDHAKVKLCDGLDAIMFAQMVAPDALARDDFKAQIKGVLAAASSLGVKDEVIDLIGADFIAKIAPKAYDTGELEAS